jgi:hypothetical protein
MSYVDELAAQEHRQELEEEARVERMLIEARAESHPPARRFSLMEWLHLRRRHDPHAEDQARRN